MAIGLPAFALLRPGVDASYALRVPRAGSLRTASFRPRLAAAALAVRLMVPAIRVHRGLSPPSQCALPGAHKKATFTGCLFTFNARMPSHLALNGGSAWESIPPGKLVTAMSAAFPLAPSWPQDDRTSRERRLPAAWMLSTYRCL